MPELRDTCEIWDTAVCQVMGTFHQGSRDLHALLEALADSKLRAKGLASLSVVRVARLEKATDFQLREELGHFKRKRDDAAEAYSV